MYMQSLYNILIYGEDELKRINLLAGILLGFSPIIHLIIVSGTDVPYGRFTSAAWGVPVNAKVAWFLQVRCLFLCCCFIFVLYLRLICVNVDM